MEKAVSARAIAINQRFFKALNINLSAKAAVIGGNSLSASIRLILDVLDQRGENKSLRESWNAKKSVVIIK